MTEETDSLYKALGGAQGCHAIAEQFYARVDKDPILRPLFPGKNLHCATEEFAAFLVQFTGGPSEHSQFRHRISLRESHSRFTVRQEHRTAWLRLMYETLDDLPLEPSLRSELKAFFAESSAYITNRGRPQIGDTASKIGNPVISGRWEVQIALDQVVSAIGAGDFRKAIGLTTSHPLAKFLPANDSIHVGLLGKLARSADASVAEYTRQALHLNVELVSERYNNRTLLHDACAAGNRALVKLLLSLGADPNACEHSPLYRLANECWAPTAPAIAGDLVQAGANVNAVCGPKKCTPLHMAARRDFSGIAAALLDCGADIEAKDSQRESPLRRAVNCNSLRVAKLLVARGANLQSTGSKGLTPLTAARSDAMRSVLREVR